MALSFWVIDKDSKRRQQVCRTLLNAGIYVSPFADLDELAEAKCDGGDASVLISDENGMVPDVAQLLASNGIAGSLLAYSEAPKPTDVVDALRSGASDYLNWPIDVVEVQSRISNPTHAARADVEARSRAIRARKAVSKLSGREVDVLKALCDGQTNKGTARRLGISPRTVEIHRANMMRKLNVSHVSEVVRIGLESFMNQ